MSSQISLSLPTSLSVWRLSDFLPSVTLSTFIVGCSLLEISTSLVLKRSKSSICCSIFQQTFFPIFLVKWVYVVEFSDNWTSIANLLRTQLSKSNSLRFFVFEISTIFFLISSLGIPSFEGLDESEDSKLLAVDLPERLHFLSLQLLCSLSFQKFFTASDSLVFSYSVPSFSFKFYYGPTVLDLLRLF